jgi:hypothetical protein
MNVADFLSFICSRLIPDFHEGTQVRQIFICISSRRHRHLVFFSTGAEYCLEDIGFDIVMPSILNLCTSGIQLCVFS